MALIEQGSEGGNQIQVGATQHSRGVHERKSCQPGPAEWN
jgi:hypothetical protein